MKDVVFAIAIFVAVPLLNIYAWVVHPALGLVVTVAYVGLLFAVWRASDGGSIEGPGPPEDGGE